MTPLSSHRTAPAAKTVEREYMSCCYQGGFGKKLMMTLLGILLVYIIFLVGSLLRNDLKKFYYIGKADRAERTIMVTGYGKVSAQNDIAVTTLGYSNTNKDVAKAQAENKKVMDQIMDELKKMGIDEKDLQSNYSIYPDYNYSPTKGQELVGYRVNNQVTIKIRDLSKIPTILGLAGKYGATEVSGLTFTIDDPENLKAQAREKALADAKAKARVLASQLGVSVVDVISYNEYESAPMYYDMYKSSLMAEGGGMGGGAPAAVSAGSRDVVINNTVTFEISSR